MTRSDQGSRGTAAPVGQGGDAPRGSALGGPPLHPLAPDRLGGRAPDMITVDDAVARIMAAFSPLQEHQRVPLLEAMGRVLVEDIPADIDIPPFDNSAMDGYAVQAADVATATSERPVSLRVLGEIAAGRVATGALGPGQAYRILTGAPIPVGADAVVPYEDTDGQGFGGWSSAAGAALAAEERLVRVYRSVERGDNLRRAGEDQKKGEVVIRSGTVVRPAEVGVLASLGRTQAWVYRRPRVAVLSTGDEVVPVDQPLRPGQIRNANSWSLLALISHYGGSPIPLGIAPDQPEAVRAALLAGVAAGADLLLTSGGVSMGDYDVVKGVLQEEGDIAFWSIDLRPGASGLRGRPGSADHGSAGQPRLLDGHLRGSSRARPSCAWPATAACARWSLSATALQPITNRSGRENYMRDVVSPSWQVQAVSRPRSYVCRRGIHCAGDGRDRVGRALDRGAGFRHLDLYGQGQLPGAHP